MKFPIKTLRGKKLNKKKQDVNFHTTLKKNILDAWMIIFQSSKFNHQNSSIKLVIKTFDWIIIWWLVFHFRPNNKWWFSKQQEEEEKKSKLKCFVFFWFWFFNFWSVLMMISNRILFYYCVYMVIMVFHMVGCVKWRCYPPTNNKNIFSTIRERGSQCCFSLLLLCLCV